ncbi:hypothetical protein DBT_1440 [Dissulfuribacter thermophilus]|uniref:DUF83 domain-containing protein n=1 Tax=Dissulfuribacter thermophilus TaxID=1156395 RepID=A0A1B9F5U7_9BACT|nr:Dna2/Cas4 domain-containing protein [Dissulfuribacter thermophilus]OCC15317.1 hypothetical protein DBT_1440 [Dissulfuribacter thermophilus]
MVAFESFILTRLQELSALHTKQYLGDRSQYIGASDIGHCPRKVVLSKLNGEEIDLATHIKFMRGHLAEDLVAGIYEKYNPQRQVELELDDPVPIKIHLDLLFQPTTKQEVGVMEVKASSIPETPYELWEMQLHFQMGVMARHTQKAIKGAIIVVDLNDGDIRRFNGYTPNETIFNGLLKRAKHIWDCITEGTEPETEVTPLCGYCAFIKDCPRFQADEIPELAGDVLKVLEAKDRKKASEAEYKRLASRLLDIVKKKGAFKAGGHRIDKIDRHSTRTDWKKLADDLGTINKSLDDYQTKNPYSVLDIKTLQ